MQAGLPHELVHGNANRYRTAVAHRVFGVRGDLAQQPDAILDGTAIFVRAVVVAARKKVMQEADSVGGVHIDEIETRALCATHGIEMPAPKVANVVSVHAASLKRLRRERR